MSDPDSERSTVELWWASVGDAAPSSDELLGLLDEEERRRAGRFRVADAGRRFMAARAMLRCLLGRRLGVPPRELALIAGPHGKPAIAAGGAVPHFNLSHSGDVAVVAIAHRELGVDVEALRTVPRAERLAERYFAETERQWLVGLPSSELDRSFLSLWTCKEAYLKALGTGIGIPLARVEVDPVRSTLLGRAGDPHGQGCWTLLRVELPVPAVCTVAIRGTGWRLEVRKFDWQSAGVEC